MGKHRGIKLRHKKACARTPCTCQPSYRPTVYDRYAGRKIEGPTFRTLAEAKRWRTLRAADVERGRVIVASTRTLREVAEEFLHGANTGHLVNRNGHTPVHVDGRAAIHVDGEEPSNRSSLPATPTAPAETHGS